MKDSLPVVEKEIGDTWIHGAGTDPMKVSRYRKLLRYISENKTDCDLGENLLLVPEHTWGMDLKTYFPNVTAYTHKEMEKIPEERARIEKSWREQREYVCSAEKALGVTPDYPVSEPDLSEYYETEVPEKIDYEISWQLFDREDYERYKRDYIRISADWAIWDITKVGLPEYKGGIFAPSVTHAYKRGGEILYVLEFAPDFAEEYGLPKFYLSIDGENVTLKWFGKKDSRLPQAIWFKFKGFSENWEINKLGAWIRPENVVGSPLICAVDEGVRNAEAEIQPYDSPLVAPFGRMLLEYGCDNPPEDLYFNLYNNIWNTNFPAWYSDDGLCRFKITQKR